MFLLNRSIVFLCATLFLLGCAAAAPPVPTQTPPVSQSTETPEPAAPEPALSQTAQPYTLSAAESTLIWTGSKPIGESHTGTVELESGQLLLEGDQVVSGAFTIDMTTITNTNLGAGQASMLENHLKSEDFFAVDQFPTASLAIRSVEPLADNRFDILADLTIKGITQPIRFEAQAQASANRLDGQAAFSIDRSQFDVRYGSGSFFTDLGNDLIDDMIQFEVNLVAFR